MVRLSKTHEETADSTADPSTAQEPLANVCPEISRFEAQKRNLHSDQAYLGVGA